MVKKRIIFMIGSPNQTLQMFKIYEHLKDKYDCYFTQIFSNHPLYPIVAKTGLFNKTILSGRFKELADKFLIDHHLKNDYKTKVYNNSYDLAVVCTDLFITKVLLRTKTIFIQEGMTDPMTWWNRVVNFMGWEGYLGFNTALNGGNNKCDIYCVASERYAEDMSKLGTPKEKFVVTGIPNYDGAASFLENNFPLKDYVLVCSSDLRETGRIHNRRKFIKKCLEIAQGRQLVWKLHPNENYERAAREIREEAGEDVPIYLDGPTESMIANCSELITQYSSVVYIGLALGKKCHSYFPLDEIKAKTPVQTGGRSAKIIADLCDTYINYKGSLEDFLKNELQKFNYRNFKFINQEV